jgi:tRNA(fMet)-specific endonuclease VapC
MQKIEDLLAASAILECDVETAQHYAIIKNNLRLKGKPIPENDIWIAAIAVQHHLVMVTRDAHFKEIENLTVQSW